MANWSVLKTAVANIINTNGNQAITGQLLQNVLNNIITNVGENSTFAGTATINTNPGAPDGPVFYLAATAGTYPNFNNIKVLDGEAAIFEWNNGTWTKKVTGFATQEKLSQLASAIASYMPSDKVENYNTSNQKYLTSIGNLSDHTQYRICVYPVEPGQRFKIKGSTRGTQNVGCYALYTSSDISSSSLYSIYSIKDFVGNSFEDAKQAVIDQFIIVPQGVTTIVTCSVPSDNNDLLLFNVKRVEDYILEELKNYYSKDDVKKNEVSWKTSLLNPSWNNFGLNNTQEDLVYNIESSVWLQSDWIDARLLESIQIDNNDYTMYVVLADNNFSLKEDVIPKGHYVCYNQIDELLDIQRKIRAISFSPVFAKIWLIKKEVGNITPDSISEVGINFVYRTAKDDIETKDVANKSLIKGETKEPEQILDTYIKIDGNLREHESYKTKVYNVKGGEIFRVAGSTMGTEVVACFALYKNNSLDSNGLYSIYSIKDFVGNSFEDAKTATIDMVIQIPNNVSHVATCYSIYDKDEMLLYQIVGTKEYIDSKLYKEKYVDCLGDSLTMGATRFGWYEDTLQELLGDGYKVRNWGVGGEQSSSIMARQGSDSIRFQEDWILRADGTTTMVMNTEDNNLIIKTQSYEKAVALLLQGSQNDPSQQNRVVNPCYINGVECVMSYTQGSEYGKGKWYIKRKNVGSRDINVSKNTPVYFNTGKEMGKSSITIIWMGTNDGGYSDWQELVDKQIMATNKVSNGRYIVIGLHKLDRTNGEEYEALMRKAFGNKFFNIREYMSTNMIYDAGIKPTSSDLSAMSEGKCPQSLLYDGTHLKPESNIALGNMLYNVCVELGYI